MASLGSAANVYATCLRILRGKGYALAREVGDYEADDGPHGYVAQKDGFTFAGVIGGASRAGWTRRSDWRWVEGAGRPLASPGPSARSIATSGSTPTPLTTSVVHSRAGLLDGSTQLSTSPLANAKRSSARAQPHAAGARAAGDRAGRG
jgi:hypothetical protein